MVCQVNLRVYRKCLNPEEHCQARMLCNCQRQTFKLDLFRRLKIHYTETQKALQVRLFGRKSRVYCHSPAVIDEVVTQKLSHFTIFSYLPKMFFLTCTWCKLSEEETIQQGRVTILALWFLWHLSKTMPLWVQYRILKFMYRILCKTEGSRPH